jgi:hypothetical protein
MSAKHTPGPSDFICQGRAFRYGKWLPWHTISAEVYENRKRWPRDGYEVRATMIPGASVNPCYPGLRAAIAKAAGGAK